eukprot:3940756-Rhodomonas_salina.6
MHAATRRSERVLESSVSSYALAMRCAVLTQHTMLSAYALSLRCPVLIKHIWLSAYARATRCPVLTIRYAAIRCRCCGLEATNDDSGSSCYAMSVLKECMVLSGCYAMSVPYDTTQCPVLTHRLIPGCYAMSDTTIPYDGFSLRACYAMSGTALAYNGAVTVYAMSGTEIAP